MYQYTQSDFVKSVLKKRPAGAHKGDFGRILLIAGTEEMAGAAVLSGKAAIRSGSGLVHMCTEKSIFPVIQISQPELICCTWEAVKNRLSMFDAVAAGPGLGVNKRTEEILFTLLTSCKGKMVIDADGLNTVASNEELQELVRKESSRIIFTPHTGEAERLLGGISLRNDNMQEKGRKLHEKYGCTVVVKGHESLVVTKSSEGFFNTTGNPGMATAGSGDVLTGIITSLLGQGLQPEDAARAGVFIHGLAGDTACRKYGEYGMIAGDIALAVPEAIKEITEDN